MASSYRLGYSKSHRLDPVKERPGYSSFEGGYSPRFGYEKSPPITTQGSQTRGVQRPDPQYELQLSPRKPATGYLYTENENQYKITSQSSVWSDVKDVEMQRLIYKSPYSERYKFGAESMTHNFSEYKKVLTWRNLWFWLAKAYKVKCNSPVMLSFMVQEQKFVYLCFLISVGAQIRCSKGLVRICLLVYISGSA